MEKTKFEEIKKLVLPYYDKACIAITEEERNNLEIADFGLNDIENIGLQIITYINTERCCAKEMVLLPGQTCPEHAHVPMPEKNYPGKEETFRCRYGTVYLYVDGEATENISGHVPSGYEDTYTVMHEVILNPGEQYTIMPNTKHWFQAGPQGCVVSEFSTTSYDEYDIFTDKNIQRIPVIEG